MLYRQVVPGNHPLNGWETWRRKDGLWICIDDPKGGWGCIDYDGNVKIPLKYHLIIDGNTDLNAIVIMDQTGHAGVLRISGMKGINELAFKNKRTDERYPFFLITNTSGKFALFDKDLRQITEYKFIEWREGHAHRHPHYASRFWCSLQRF